MWFADAKILWLGKFVALRSVLFSSKSFTGTSQSKIALSMNHVVIRVPGRGGEKGGGVTQIRKQGPLHVELVPYLDGVAR
jgi:hypothetical protein